jgi:uncharacterized protein
LQWQEAIANDAVFEYRYIFPGFPTKAEGRDALMALYAGYGDSTVLHSGDGLIVQRSQDPRGRCHAGTGLVISLVAR